LLKKLICVFIRQQDTIKSKTSVLSMTNKTKSSTTFKLKITEERERKRKRDTEKKKELKKRKVRQIKTNIDQKAKKELRLT
jgi:hypothetical protein